MIPVPLVLLTDNNDDALPVVCVDDDEAHRLASAATMSDGGVSAWLVDVDHALPCTPGLIAELRAGLALQDLEEA